jgi:hypothetical protein
LEVDIDFDGNTERAAYAREFPEGKAAPLLFKALHPAEADVLPVPILDIPGPRPAGIEELYSKEGRKGFSVLVEVVGWHLHKAASPLHECELSRSMGDAGLVDVFVETNGGVVHGKKKRAVGESTAFVWRGGR